MSYLLEMPDEHLLPVQLMTKRMEIAYAAYKVLRADLEAALGRKITDSLTDITPDDIAKFPALVAKFTEAAEEMKTAVLAVRDRLHTLDRLSEGGRKGGAARSEKKRLANIAHGFKKREPGAPAPKPPLTVVHAPSNPKPAPAPIFDEFDQREGGE
jgi:hypothetical protein